MGSSRLVGLDDLVKQYTSEYYVATLDWRELF